MGKLRRPLSLSKCRTSWEVGGTFPIVFQVSYFLGGWWYIMAHLHIFPIFRVGSGKLSCHEYHRAKPAASGVNPLNSSLALKISVAQCSLT